jgi:hypothetical protein
LERLSRKISKNLEGDGEDYLPDSTVMAFMSKDYAIHKKNLSHNRRHIGQNLIPITNYKLNALLLHPLTQPFFTYLIKKNNAKIKKIWKIERK